MNSVQRALAVISDYWQAVREFLGSTHEPITPEERAERIALLGKTLRLFLPLAVIIAILNAGVATINGHFWQGVLVNLPGLVLAFLIERLTHTRRYRLLVWLPPLCGIPLIYALALQAGPPYLYLFVLAIFPMYGALLLYMQANIYLALLSLTALIGFYLLFPNAIPGSVFLQWIGIFVMFEALLLFFAAYMLRLETRSHRVGQNQQRLDAMRDFIRNISHDFRTPLTVIQSSAYLLLRLEDPERRAKQAQQIDRMVARMEQMLNNTVMLARLQSLRTITFAPVNLNEVFEVLQQTYPKVAAEKGLHFEMQIPADLPEMQGDADLLLATLQHVLDNAMRYTDEGGRVWVSAQVTGRGLAITIADTGMGIAQEQLDRIFEPLYRTDTARAMDTGGTGVGLAIAQLAIELHGGRIHVTSEQGTGSQFTIELPSRTESDANSGCLPRLLE